MAELVLETMPLGEIADSQKILDSFRQAMSKIPLPDSLRRSAIEEHLPEMDDTCGVFPDMRLHNLDAMFPRELLADSRSSGEYPWRIYVFPGSDLGVQLRISTFVELPDGKGIVIRHILANLDG